MQDGAGATREGGGAEPRTASCSMVPRTAPPIPRLVAVALALVAASALAARPLAAQAGSLRDVSDEWAWHRAAPGEDLSGLAVADGWWPLTSLTASWREQGLEGVTGTIWYRKRVEVPSGIRGRGAHAGLLVGALAHGSWDLWVDGRLLASHGDASEAAPFPQDRVVGLPEAAVEDGVVVLALAVHRRAWAADAAGGGAPAFRGVVIGPSEELGTRIALDRAEQREGALGSLVFAVVALLVGLGHLWLYVMRPSERAYLWFGTACVGFAVNAIAYTPWTVGAFTGLGAPYRLTSGSGHLAAAALLWFLWAAFGHEPGRLSAWYARSHVVLGALVLLVPFRWVVSTEPARFVWLVPGLALAGVLLVGELRRAHPDARYLAAAMALIALGEAGELLRVFGLSFPEFLPYAGFISALLAISLMLAARFSRAHAALDALRLELEERVAERTRELADATRRAEAANEAKSRFLANVSHELRTPLNAVIGFSNILLKRARQTSGSLSAAELDFLARIRRNGAHLLDMVNRLLDLSLIESGQVDVVSRPVDLGRLVGELLAELSPAAGEKGLNLSAVVPEAMEPIETDPIRMRQILTNLVDNAVRFSERGSVTVRVVAPRGRPRWIEVTDQGPGIPSEQLAEVMEPFTQADTSHSRRHYGAGLGLAIVGNLCRLLGFGFTLESEVGTGTSARLDLAPAEAAPGVQSQAPPREVARGVRRVDVRSWLASDAPEGKEPG